MLIIAIGFDSEITCSVEVEKINALDKESLLKLVVQDSDTDEVEIDRLLVIENDKLIMAYDPKDSSKTIFAPGLSIPIRM